jgi:choice-of-anchor C domain-containing protein
MVNGLVGAFLAGLVIATGCFLVYYLFGGTLGYPVASDQFWPFCWLVLAWGSICTHALLLVLDHWPVQRHLLWASDRRAKSSMMTTPQLVLEHANTQSGRRTNNRPRDGRRRRRWLWLVSLILIIIALLLPRYASKPTPVAFTGIVKDGDFEVPRVPVARFNEYYAGQTFGNWSVATGSIDLIDEQYWQAGHGQQSVDMDGDSAGAIYQDLPTRVGATYTLSFLLAANPECGDIAKTMQIWWGGKLLDSLQTSPHGHDDQHMGWHNSLVYATHTAVNLKFPYVVRASASLTRLEFASLTPGYCGAAIDLVSVVETSAG